MGLITIKTNYGKQLDGVYYELCKGRKRMATLKDKDGHYGITLKVKDNWHPKPQDRWITMIGCNSFGIEVKEQGGGWYAIEQLSGSQQQRVIKAIDWSTLE